MISEIRETMSILPLSYLVLARFFVVQLGQRFGRLAREKVRIASPDAVGESQSDAPRPWSLVPPVIYLRATMGTLTLFVVYPRQLRTYPLCHRCLDPSHTA